MDTLYENMGFSDISLANWTKVWQSIRHFRANSIEDSVYNNHTTAVLTSGGDSQGIDLMKWMNIFELMIKVHTFH